MHRRTVLPTHRPTAYRLPPTAYRRTDAPTHCPIPGRKTHSMRPNPGRFSAIRRPARNPPVRPDYLKTTGLRRFLSISRRSGTRDAHSLVQVQCRKPQAAGFGRPKTRPLTGPLAYRLTGAPAYRPTGGRYVSNNSTADLGKCNVECHMRTEIPCSGLRAVVGKVCGYEGRPSPGAKDSPVARSAVAPDRGSFGLARRRPA